MLKSFIANLQAGLKWLAEEMARPMPGIESKTSRRHASGPNQKLEPRRSRRPPPAAPENNHDEDRHHNQAYDGDAFHSDSGGDGGGD